MLVKNITNTFLGALLSLIAAHLLFVIAMLRNEISNYGRSSLRLVDIFIGGPLYTLIHIYWILIPIGALCGVVIPLLVSKKTRRQALVYGILIGITMGLFFAGFSAYDFAVGTSFGSDDNVKWWRRFWGEVASALPLMIVYCSIWTGAYAFIKAGGDGVEHNALN